MLRIIRICLLASFLFTAGCALAPTPFPTRTPTHTATATLTPSLTPRATDTATPRPPTATPSPSATFTPSPTHTFTPSSTPTATATPTHTATPTPTPNPLACGATQGTVQGDRVRSTVLGDVLNLRVYLPPCYEEAASIRYPVLYLFHGLAANEKQWDDLGADETADRLIAAVEVYPFIIVMVRDRGEANLGDAVVVDLLPYVDANYRTRTDRRDRAIGGLSRGGGWAVFLGLKHADLFHSLGGHSPAIQPIHAELIIPILRAMPERDFPRVYFDIGEQDDLKPDNTDWLQDRLIERGMPFKYLVNPGDHVPTYWIEHLEEYLRFYAAEWP